MKRFSVHDLYPKDYCFDYEAFEADPKSLRSYKPLVKNINFLQLKDHKLKSLETSLYALKKAYHRFYADSRTYYMKKN